MLNIFLEKKWEIMLVMMNYAENNVSGTIYQSLSAEADQPKADKCFYYSFKITSNLNTN